MDFNDTLDELNITLGDSANVTFTPEEKQRALQKAWKDSYVVKTVWDTTTAFDTNTYRYLIPITMTTVKGISLSAGNSTDSFPDPIDSSLWSVVNGYIQFNSGASIIPDNYTLYVKGAYKYNYLTDTITDVNMQEYIIALAGYNTLGLLGYKKANLFLKNDTSMGELITLKRDLREDVKEARAKLLREFEAV